MDKLKELVKKPWFWIAIAVVAGFALLSQRRKAGASAAPSEAPGSFLGAPGSGGGAPVSGGPSIVDQLNQLDLDAMKQRMANEQIQFDFSQREEERRAGILGPLEALQGALEGVKLNTDIEQAGRLQQAGKNAKVQCPVGMHLVNTPEEGLHCQPLGGGGFKPFKQIGDILGGLLGGVAAAAPVIGYGAANAYAGRQGVFKPRGAGQTTGQTQPTYRQTPLPTRQRESGFTVYAT